MGGGGDRHCDSGECFVDIFMSPKVSFIVSAYDRPRQLACVLASLAVQTLEEIEVLVVDNQRDPSGMMRNQIVVDVMGDMDMKDPKRDIEERRRRRFSYHAAMRNNCYMSSEAGAQYAKGEWLCFPSDDNYYVPEFAVRMVAAAERAERDLPAEPGGGPPGGRALPRVGFVYCDMIYDPRLKGDYSVVDVRPVVNNVDKGGFLVRRDLFLEVGGFPDKENGVVCDGLFVEELVRRGVRGVKAAGVLWVHN